MASVLEKSIMRRLLLGELTIEQGERAMRNPKAFKLSVQMEGGNNGKNMRYRYWGRVKTPRTYVAYCWSTRRNEAGYFLGWREHYDEYGNRTERDQWFAQKVKKRIAERQLLRTKALLDRGGKTTKRNVAAIDHHLAKLPKSATGEG